jgi:hypothetical protein
MSKTPFEPTPQLDEDDILAEYDFDYRLAKPNRFVPEGEEQRLKVVVLDEDVAKIFKTSESVNKVLRAFIESVSL